MKLTPKDIALIVMAIVILGIAINGAYKAIYSNAFNKGAENTVNEIKKTDVHIKLMKQGFTSRGFDVQK